MKELSREVLWYGKNEPLPVQQALRAGNLNLVYESGSIRTIRLGGIEVVRMIYVALRDEHWGTVIPTISNEKIEINDTGFSISYLAQYRKDKIKFDLKVSIEGNSDSSIIFEIDGKAQSEFMTNRTGFCLLQPTKECIGKTCSVVSPDGQLEDFIFPEQISPHQPVKNISEMSWPIGNVGTAYAKFEGEVFEMEDQRNWTDDSFKTYCRPVDLPFPYALKKGEQVRQTIRLSVESNEELNPDLPANYHLTYDETLAVPLPEIGTRKSPGNSMLQPGELNILGKVNFSFYEVYIDFSDAWKVTLQHAIHEAEILEIPLKLVLSLTEDFEDQIAQLVILISARKVTVNAILIVRKADDENFEELLDRVFPLLHVEFTLAKIGTGTSDYFADLNRNRIAHPKLDFVSYSLNPQVHAFDNQTMVENLAGQKATILSAKQFAAGKKVHVSHVTLRMPGDMDHVNGDKLDRPLPDSIDPRQMSLFGAGWTMGSIKKLSEAGAAAITYYEAVGEKGVIMGERPSLFPREFLADSGTVFPLYYVLKEVLKGKNAELIQSASSHPLIFEGMVLKSGDKKMILLANFTSEQIEIRVDGIAPDAIVKKLDEKSAVRAMYEHEQYEASPFCEFRFDGPVTTFKVRPFGLVFVNE